MCSGYSGRQTSEITNACTSSFFLLAFIAEQTSYGREYTFGQFGSAVLTMSTPKILPTPSLWGGRGACRRDSLDAVRALLSSSQNTGVLSTPF